MSTYRRRIALAVKDGRRKSSMKPRLLGVTLALALVVASTNP